MRDGAVVVGPLEVQAQGSAVRGEAQTALQAGVRLHGGVARPELVCEPFEGVRDADAQGAEALAVALKGNLKGGSAALEVIEEVTPARMKLEKRHKVNAGPWVGLRPPCVPALTYSTTLSK